MADRFFVPELDPAGPIRMTGEEAHHLAHVRRIGRGARVSLFDGSGAEWDAVVEQVGKRDVTLSVAGRQLVDRELPFTLTLACAPPKGDRLRWLVEKATELGVTRFVPLRTDRTEQRVRGVKAEKMRRWVIEACKQCGRNVLMELSDPVPWPKFVESLPPALLRFLAHPLEQNSGPHTSLTRKRGEFGSVDEMTQAPLQESLPWNRGAGGPPAVSSIDKAGGPPAPRLTSGVVIAVGPEGGFTDVEVELARQRGWSIVDLGPRALRIETAALALVAGLTLRFPPAALSSSIPSPTS